MAKRVLVLGIGNVGMATRSLTRGFPASRWSVSVKGGSPIASCRLSSATMQAKSRTAGPASTRMFGAVVLISVFPSI
jgi:hypothetical protein